MKNLIENVLDLARMKKVSYADVRLVRTQSEEIEVKNGKVEALTRDEDVGFGIRVLYQGAWGFACSSKAGKKEMETIFGRALRIANASSKAKANDVLLSSASPVVATYETPTALDP